MDLNEHVDQITTREELSEYLRVLAQDLSEHPDRLEADNVPSYLLAVAAWIDDMDGYFQNSGEAPPGAPTWRLLGQILTAATVYE